MNERFSFGAGLPFLLCLSLAGTAAHAEAEQTMRASPVNTMESDGVPSRPITGAEALLKTSTSGATMTLRTSGLTPGHVTTAWWVIIGAPENCENVPCAPSDGIGRSDIVGTQIVYADGVVNNPDGTASFAAYLPSGSVAGGWYDQDFEDPKAAEIHLVLNDHGPLVPEIAASMLTSYRGGCLDESLPPSFPDRAKADGIPGPNQCVLIQNAIFVAEE